METENAKDDPSRIITLATDLEKLRPLLWLAFSINTKNRQKAEDRAIDECDGTLAWLFPIDIQILREKVRSFVLNAQVAEIECLKQAMSEVRGDIGPLMSSRFAHREEWEGYRILTSMIVDLLDGIWKQRNG